MAIIKFNDPGEFIQELQRMELARPIVRLTCLRRNSEKYSPLTFVFVVVTTKAADGDILRLEHYGGQLWGHKPEDEKTWAYITKVDAQIRKACQDLALEVRAGVLEPQGEK